MREKFLNNPRIEEGIKIDSERKILSCQPGVDVDNLSDQAIIHMQRAAHGASEASVRERHGCQTTVVRQRLTFNSRRVLHQGTFQGY